MDQTLAPALEETWPWYENPDENHGSALFGWGWTTPGEAENETGWGDDPHAKAFRKYRNMGGSFSSDGNTPTVSEYGWSFSGTTEIASNSLYSPVETVGIWDFRPPADDTLDPRVLDNIKAMTGEFKSSSSIDPTAPIPNVPPELHIDNDFEDMEEFVNGDWDGGDVEDIQIAACPPPSADRSVAVLASPGRYKKLERFVGQYSDTVPGYSEIVDASGLESQDDQRGRRVNPEPRGPRHPHTVIGSDSQRNSQPGRDLGAAEYQSEATERSYRSERNFAVPKIITSPPSRGSQGDYQKRQRSNIDTSRTAPQKRPRAQRSNLRQLEPKMQVGTSPLVSEKDYLQPPSRSGDHVPRFKNGEYVCTKPGCKKRYNRSENLSRHVRINHPKNGECEPLTCPECGAVRGTWRAKENMRTHMKKEHGKVWGFE
ncbi:hypothetical protein TWF481_008739 [Arthrobotrys musiformis]|uniref:C2H2-type domain-containing protein n=1 Tax=Arthrobotrys musiformis TaxID=47236 RepID=A0AAV9W910_9PEZI